MFWLQVPAASDSDSEGDELVQRYLAESGDSDEDALQGLPQWEQPEGGELLSNSKLELQRLHRGKGQYVPSPQAAPRQTQADQLYCSVKLSDYQAAQLQTNQNTCDLLYQQVAAVGCGSPPGTASLLTGHDGLLSGAATTDSNVHWIKLLGSMHGN